ncbi:PREDICTED: putative FBD-associated F-box protein At5g56560 [Camelina sativa]|uniref:FBD-associated F-box protein At5g56560 n=1 Tax=Camelina sativa TaxID=90675 RepID=A0ABM0WVI8_CAMSA|nr:PREDICTED: putative FBD-associated F-box protein At5g56560 [Camelina sativa]
MESINDLPDEMLVKILSSFPTFKETIRTSLISKRWQDLWKLVPVFNLNDNLVDDYDDDGESFKSFVYRCFLFSKAQVLERLCLKLLLPYYKSSIINDWVKTGVTRSVKELQLNMCGNNLQLPSCLGRCRTLETLKLQGLKLKVLPQFFRLPSVKTLHLLSVKFPSDESVESLLSSCPVLENLVVNKKEDDNVVIFNISVPTLRSLTINNSEGVRTNNAEIHGFVIKAPSLVYLNIKDTFSNFIMFEYMPEVIKANIEVVCDQSEKFIGSLTSIQHLSLCSRTSKIPYHRGSFFFYLEHLELRTSYAGWWNLLYHILEDAPRLKSLKLDKSKHTSSCDIGKITLSKVVPKCSLTHLEILEWRSYKGTNQEMNVAKYILKNATCLKKATFSTRYKNKNGGILLKLKSTYRVSKRCQLVID